MPFFLPFLALYLLQLTHGYSTGPPTSVCRSLSPDSSPTGHNAVSLSSQTPYKLTILNSPFNTYQTGDHITLELSDPSEKSFVGFMVQGRDSEGHPTGTFIPQNGYQQNIHCEGHSEGNSIAHYNGADDKLHTQQLVWRGIRSDNVTFYYTVVHELDEYWSHVQGPTLYYLPSQASRVSAGSALFTVLLAVCMLNAI